MHSLKRLVERILPRSAYRALVAPYHFLYSLAFAVGFGFPAKKLHVIGVTGTKGKSSVTEMLAAILEEAGHTVAVSSTIHFRIGHETRPNTFKMTVPGRGFLQKFLAEAVRKGADFAVIELTSEGALQYRHTFLSLDAVVFTNLEKEHVESHGSMENYFRAKLRIGTALVRSSKRPRAVIANEESEYGRRFLALPVERALPFSLADAAQLELAHEQTSFTYDDTRITLPHPGAFSARNALAAIKTAAFFGVSVPVAASALASLSRIPGRAETISAGQDFLAVVDYAHTPDSLQALYNAYPDRRKICVLGNTGGGRDTWKRPEMGRIAETSCAEVILTNEDPYDEDPEAILNDMAAGMIHAPRIIMDRREAIRTALTLARSSDAVLITGKGTDPYIMEAKGAKTPWSDARVVKEELERLRGAAT